MKHSRRHDDPQFWMTAKRDGQCSECEGEIVTGSRMVFDVTNHKAYCRQCGEMMLGPEEER